MDNRVVFVNVTKQCNVNCPRCYLTEDSRSGRQRLPVEYLDRILDSQYIHSADEVSVILQGGEPSILGHDLLSGYVRAIKRRVPHARVSMVSNLLNMPDWLIDFSLNELDGRLETTYASGYKFTLDGSAEKYNERFAKSLAKATSAGLLCPINVELNRETYERGPQYLVDLALAANARVWEFDFSVDFAAFHKEQSYNLFGYPVVAPTLKYDEFYQFVLEFSRLFGIQTGMELSCGVMDQFEPSGKSINFNIQREKDFITINPDGSITTNPLFSDIVPTYLGNISTTPLDQLARSPLRIRRIMHEKKRVESCYKCPFYQRCGGGVSHLSVWDGSSNCVGGVELWKAHNEPNNQSN